MSKKATVADAELILRLYDLRREPELRKARAWWLTEFWPNTADDFLKISGALGSQENNWLRQAAGYWSMAASLVLHETLNADLFLQPAHSGEMYFILAKVHPFLKEVREKMNDPQMFANVEKLIDSSKFSRERLKWTLGRVETLKQKRAAAKAN